MPIRAIPTPSAAGLAARLDVIRATKLTSIEAPPDLIDLPRASLSSAVRLCHRKVQD